MVKNNNGEVQQKRSFVGKEAVAGALSGGATRFICQPLDVLKIRFQVCHFLTTLEHNVSFNAFINYMIIIWNINKSRSK